MTFYAFALCIVRSGWWLVDDHGFDAHKDG